MLVISDDDPSPECDYEGLLCLDTNDLMFPQTTIMQPWRTNGLVCQCFPSCSENEIKVIGRASKWVLNVSFTLFLYLIRFSIRIRHTETDRFVSIQLQQVPTQKYYRQAVREKLDIVVSVGGILGLFMGASILSLVEFIYFLTVRIINSSYEYEEEEEVNDDSSDDSSSESEKSEDDNKSDKY
jgi:amiloride-sensitive sodium channel